MKLNFARKIAALFFTLIFLISLSLNVFAKLPDLSEWNECTPYTVLADGGESNSSIDCIIVKVQGDTDINQLHMLFMAEQRSFNDEANSGLKIKFNSLGTVELHCNGEEKFNTNIFSAQIDTVASDKASKMLIIEATIGIKSGIPENLIIEFNLFDTDGIATNTYSLDISDEIPPQDDEDEEDIIGGDSKGSNSSGSSSYASSNSDADVDDWPYELAEKVIKTKATKKPKSTKSTKTKSTKTKAASKSKSSKKADSEDDYSDEDAAEIIEANSVDDVKLVNDKKILLTIGAAAIAVCLIGGCAAGIINRNRKNGRGEK